MTFLELDRESDCGPLRTISSALGRPAWSGLLLFKMLLVGIWKGGLSDEPVESIDSEIIWGKMTTNTQFPNKIIQNYYVVGNFCEIDSH